MSRLRKIANRWLRRTGLELTRRGDLEMANGCLDMVREKLEQTGLPMDGCAPMFYDDAIHNLVVTLGNAAGLKTWDEVRARLASEKGEPEQ